LIFDNTCTTRNSLNSNGFTDEIFLSVIWSRNYGRKSFQIKKKAGHWRGGFGGVIVTDRIIDGFKMIARTVTW
jgi:hypothetical protein